MTLKVSESFRIALHCVPGKGNSENKCKIEKIVVKVSPFMFMSCGCGWLTSIPGCWPGRVGMYRVATYSKLTNCIIF